jgi:hypothetical protein
MTSASRSSSAPQTRWKAVAIPPEHGAWGFLLEPILLGLFVAPSLAGFGLALAVIGAFLIRHPLKIALVDRQRGKHYARTALAERFVLIYGLPVIIGGAVAVLLAGIDILIPLLIAAPLAAILFIGYMQNRGRDMLPELAGAVAMAVSASSLALAGGESAETAFALWVILAARDVPSILYVRARLRLERDKPFSPLLVNGANALGVLSVIALAVAGFAPVLAVLAVNILAARAIYGLSPYRPRVKTQTIGFQEIGFGLMVVILAAIGYHTGL